MKKGSNGLIYKTTYIKEFRPFPAGNLAYSHPKQTLQDISSNMGTLHFCAVILLFAHAANACSSNGESYTTLVLCVCVYRHWPTIMCKTDILSEFR